LYILLNTILTWVSFCKQALKYACILLHAIHEFAHIFYKDACIFSVGVADKIVGGVKGLGGWGNTVFSYLFTVCTKLAASHDGKQFIILHAHENLLCPV
jgi:hypothetical protein